ncbi:MAG: OmpA family protein [Chitinophagaceae bacterium]|nr:OmpA family protein [Chitinophagaceae bacterium]MCA6453981.1 OmpA family protein [Chitinophagaceae bacterium]MCA6454943.1 OmpA family protein [Chitinophagaceae bacterium]MCA6458478.1 OmpA family protein [Chitinophagaceae bacterium]MCA6465106.1 OmpA family protein [Chitinophagaceae bacterium]
MQKTVLPVILYLMMLPVAALCQTGGQDALLKNAEREYQRLRYSYAIPFYAAHLVRQPQDTLALLHLADSYRLLKQNDSAAVYYRRYLSLKPADKSNRRRYAELVASLGDYAEAINAYTFLKQTGSQKKDSLAELAIQRTKGFAETDLFLRDSLDYQIRYLKLNTEQQDFSPFMSGPAMVFVSNRYRKINEGKEFGWDGLPFAQFYQVNQLDDAIDAFIPDPKKAIAYNRVIRSNHDYTSRTSNDNDMIQLNTIPGSYKGFFKDLPAFAEALSGNFNMGPACINQEGNRIYYTRNSTSLYRNKYHLEIWEAVYSRGQWQHPRKLPFVKEGYDFYHPAISADGKTLYFCSNMPGGFGGSDVYAVNTTNYGAREIPRNLGDRVNTAGDELFPVVNRDTLYFSSDGHPGLGGLDIYRTVPATESRHWSEPVNMGYPVNSSADDFGMVFRNNREDGFLTSNRQGTDDIFYFTRNDYRVQLSGTLLDRTSQRRLPETVITIHNWEKTFVDSLVTDMTGNYRFGLKPGQLYVLQFRKDGYITDSITVDLRSTKETALELSPAVLASVSPAVATMPVATAVTDTDGDGVPDRADKCPSAKGIPKLKGCPDLSERLSLLAKNIFFATASAEIRDSSYRSLNELASLLLQFPDVTLEINGYTDNKGSFLANMQLSKRRADAIKDFLVSKGIRSELLRANGYGPANPIASNAQESGRFRNRRVEMKAFFKT